ncbi:hypothetical protein [Rhodopila sp.]|uniref:hypothetical protein n=1 Tax=Rhodopila sp. TaxID=2480087 RepID=UPI003D0A93C9
MRYRMFMLSLLCASFALAAVVPAFAQDNWRRRDIEDHRQEEWREHEQREHEWREHEWREHQGYYAPAPFGAHPGFPFVAPPAYGYYAPPPVYRRNPAY